METYQVWYKEDDLYIHVANVQSAELLGAFMRTQHSFGTANWHDIEGVEPLQDESRSTFYGDVIIDPEGMEFVYTVQKVDGLDGHYPGFKETTVIQEQVVRLEELANEQEYYRDQADLHDPEMGLIAPAEFDVSRELKRCLATSPIHRISTGRKRETKSPKKNRHMPQKISSDRCGKSEPMTGSTRLSTGR
jgi:hypothetical protein